MASNSSLRIPRPTFVRLLAGEVRALLRLLRWWPILPMLLLFVASSFFVYQSPGHYFVDVGTPSDQAYTRNFHARLDAGATTYRWSDVYGYLLFPGIGGSRPFTVTLNVDTGRTAPLQVFINGEQAYSATVSPGWQTLALRIDQTHPQALQSRDTVVELRSTDYRTEDSPSEPKGVKVDSVDVVQDPSGTGIIAPALAPLLWLILALLLLYLIVGRAALAGTSLPRARHYGLLAQIVGAAILVWLLAHDRLFIAADASHIATTLFTLFLIFLLVELALRALSFALTPLQCRVLAGVTAVAFLLRFGGMALPQSLIIDMPYHMKWLNTLLAGDWQSLYFPGGLSAVPREWGMELLIPKSPLFYAAFAPLSLLPFDLETSAKWLISLLDSSVVLLVFWLARLAGARLGAALFASALYAVMPLAFRSFAYGILPTIFAQWLAVLFFASLLAVATRRIRPSIWLGLLLLLCLVLLSFPTIALFVSIVIVACALLLLFRPSLRPQALPAFPWVLLAMLVVAWLLAFWAYYGLYVSPVLTSVSALLAPAPGQQATVRWPGGLPDLLAWTGDYLVSVLPLLLAVAGFVLLLGKHRSPSARRAVALLTLWLLILPLFFLANYKVDMIGKHLFFTMVPVAIGAGVALFALARRGKWSAVLAALSLTLIAWQGLIFWIARLVGQSS